MAINTSISNHTITCPICGKQAHKIYASDITVFERDPKPMTLYPDSKLHAIGCDHCLAISATGKTKEYAVGTDEPVVLPQWRGYEGDVAVDKDGVIIGRADHLKVYDADELLLHLDLSKMGKCPCCGHHADVLYINERMGDEAIGCDHCFNGNGIGQYLKSAADAIKHRWHMHSLVAFDGKEPQKTDVYPVIRRIRPNLYNYKAAIKMMHQARPAVAPYDSLADGYIAVDELELDEEKTAEVAVALEWLGILDD